MASASRSSGFLPALVLGLVVGLGVAQAFEWPGEFSTGKVQALVELSLLNLGGSVWPFTSVIVFYVYHFTQLARELSGELPAMDRIVRRDQYLDLSSSLFLGIGVIWTAIGMRGALMYGLSNPAAGAAEGGFAVLQRMVDGGILLALSTTVVGGAGGYMMRALKALILGPALNRLYVAHGSQPMNDGLATLRRIERLLSNQGAGLGGET